jgi:hypothetical protein
MMGHVLELSADQQRELLALLTQARTDLQTDEEILAELSETFRRQLSLSAATDLAEGFRRRMIRIAEELGNDEHRPPGYFDFQSDRAIAEELLEQVGLQAKTLANSVDSQFMVDFVKTFRTMSQVRRAAWLREAAVAASTAKTGEADAQRANAAARQKSSAEETAESIAIDVADFDMAYRLAREAVAAGAKRAAPSVGDRPAAALAAAAAPLGLVAAGAVSFAIRQRKVAKQKARDAKQKARDDEKARKADVQVRRERQATQAVVTTCAYMLAALDDT